jgi:hypothetical protein
MLTELAKRLWRIFSRAVEPGTICKQPGRE